MPDPEPDDPRNNPEPPVPLEDDAERRRRHRELVVLLTPLTLAVVAGFVASALTPTLLARHPLALLALEPRTRNLLLTASLVDPVPYFVVATLRLLAVDPFTYVLGLKYGDAGIRWVERRFAGLKPTVDLLERLFHFFGPAAVALAPGAIVCTLAGATRMAVPVFVVANVGGTLARIAIVRQVGDVFSGPVDTLRRFFDRYIWWTTLASVALVVLWVLAERARGKREIETPGEMAEELEREIEEGGEA